MKQSVTVLIVFLGLLSINGCAEKQVQFSKCITPDVATPVIDNRHPPSNLAASKQCLNNYLRMKEYSEKLLKSNQVCK